MSKVISPKAIKLATKLVEVLSKCSLKCATAESCTGGAIGAALTSVAGASQVYLGGVVSYDNSVKINTLGVREEVINTLGAVSEQCAIEMAQGVRALMNADIAVSATGIAGPGGGTKEKKVGTVIFAVATKTTSTAISSFFSGDRDTVRSKSVEFALNELLKELEEKVEL